MFVVYRDMFIVIGCFVIFYFFWIVFVCVIVGCFDVCDVWVIRIGFVLFYGLIIVLWGVIGDF